MFYFYLGFILFLSGLESITKIHIKKVLTILIFIFLIIIMGGNTNNPDTVIYNNIYYNSEFFSKDFGFGFLVLFFNKYLGFNYNFFKLFTAIFGITLIQKTVKKYVKNKKLFYILYFIYPFIMDIVQVRNFMAMSIFIFCVPYLSENDWKGTIKYTVGILIAATIQKTALVYLPLVFINNIEKKKYKKNSLLIIIGLCVVISLNKGLLFKLTNFLLINVADTLTGVGKFLIRNTNWGWLIQWGTQIINFIFIAWCKRVISSKKVEQNSVLFKTCSYEDAKKFIICVYWINMYAFIFLPLYIVNINFYRIMRNIMPLNLMCYTIILEIMNKKSVRGIIDERSLFFIMVIVFSLVMFYINYIYNGQGEYIESILIPLFKDNWIIELFPKYSA